MYAIRGRFIVKALAFLLFTAMLLVFCTSLLGTMYVLENQDIGICDNYFQTDMCRYHLANAASYAAQVWEHTDANNLRWQWHGIQSNWLGCINYIIFDSNGKMLDSYEEEPQLDKAGHIHTYTGEKVTVKTYVYADVDYDLTGVGLDKLMFDFCKGAEDYLFIVCLVSAAVGLALFVFLCFAAGRRRDTEEVVLNPIDRIPYDIYAFCCMAIGGMLVITVDELGWSFSTDMRIAYALAAVVICYMLTYSFVMTSITRIKAGHFWENTLIWRIGGKLLRWCWKWTKIIAIKCWAVLGKVFGRFGGVFGRWFGSIGELIHGLPMIAKGAAVIGAAAIVNTFMGIFMLLVGPYNSIPLLLFIIIEAGAVVVCWKLLLDMDKLKKAGQYLAEGDTEFTVDTEKMLWDFRKHGDNLNSIGQGIARAVDKQIRSERLKTELITNVSHDIKTPLTSIVNYVDLLKKEKLEGKACEYVEVLDRQSARLKKLTEDLVEASKASTGNVTVNLSRTDVGEIARQASGEYTERLQKNKLELVLNIPDPAPHIMADGRLLWRIMDNLLSNVCKYSQNGTRVYFDVRRIGGKVSISMKNISRDMLNIDPDELTERFVRGDLSRSTEGSGLGLNIARSLTELQNGTFKLVVDGDLFKAELQFNEIG